VKRIPSNLMTLIDAKRYLWRLPTSAATTEPNKLIEDLVVELQAKLTPDQRKLIEAAL
jgi:hypothetical protein